MLVPLEILAVLAVVGGYVGLPHILGGGAWFGRFLEPSVGRHELHLRRGDGGPPHGPRGRRRRRRDRRRPGGLRAGGRASRPAASPRGSPASTRSFQGSITSTRLYGRIFVGGVLALGRIADWIDRRVVDGAGRRRRARAGAGSRAGPSPSTRAIVDGAVDGVGQAHLAVSSGLRRAADRTHLQLRPGRRAGRRHRRHHRRHRLLSHGGDERHERARYPDPDLRHLPPGGRDAASSSSCPGRGPGRSRSRPTSSRASCSSATLLLLVRFDAASGDMQFVERLPWIKAIGAQYLLGVDGISLLLVLLTSLLTFVATLSSWGAVKTRLKEYYVFLLLLETGMIGVFLALDLVLFYVFWEVVLVPMYFLIGVWGGERRLYAAIKFFLYTLFGSVAMLVGILVLQGAAPVVRLDGHGRGRAGRPAALQGWIFLAFFLGFAIKVPMVPFHTWLPDAHVEAPTAGSVILAGVLLKMGAYGFLRFSLPLLPDASRRFAPVLVGLALVAIVYGALVSLMQKDMKKLIAYSSVSHMGFVMLGLFALTPLAAKGAVLQMVNHGLSTGALFLLVGVLYERRHTRLIAEFGGLAARMPVYAAVFLIIAMSSIGLPGLNGFVGEFMILMGVFPVSWVWAAVAATGIVLGAAYMLWLYQRVMFGRLENPANETLRDLTVRELATFLPLVVLVFWIGIFPKPFLDIIDKPVERIVRIVNPAHFEAPR
ncbi:MAG: NADH-quinone oxidoreductase subunit M [Ignavibacteriales bacterium]|nr:NADH-quinone oxidoreductase subunit M [Ignavibacteriales bacterium]